MNLKELRKYLISTGEYFGYPSCCIKEFIKDCNNKITYKDRGKRKCHGTGYIPCEKCNTKSIKDIINTINKNRKHDKPFMSRYRDSSNQHSALYS
jgi:hypothetical protein